MIVEITVKSKPGEGARARFLIIEALKGDGWEQLEVGEESDGEHLALSLTVEKLSPLQQMRREYFKRWKMSNGPITKDSPVRSPLNWPEPPKDGK